MSQSIQGDLQICISVPLSPKVMQIWLMQLKQRQVERKIVPFKTSVSTILKEVYCFFSIWVFSHEHSRITGLQGKGEGISLTPHHHFHPLLRHLDISVTYALPNKSIDWYLCNGNIDRDHTFMTSARKGVGIVGFLKFNTCFWIEIFQIYCSFLQMGVWSLLIGHFWSAS